MLQSFTLYDLRWKIFIHSSDSKMDFNKYNLVSFGRTLTKSLNIFAIKVISKFQQFLINNNSLHQNYGIPNIMRQICYGKVNISVPF